MFALTCPAVSAQTRTDHPAAEGRRPFSIVVYTEYWGGDFPYYLSDYPPSATGDEEGFSEEEDDPLYDAERYSEWSTTLAITGDLGEKWQAGFSASVVRKYLERDDGDLLSGLPSVSSQFGLGDSSIYLTRWEGFKGGDASLWSTLEVVFPTDQTGDPFTTGRGGAYLSARGSHLWGQWGTQGKGSVNYYRDGDTWSAEYGLGVVYQPYSGLWFSVVPGGEYTFSTDWDIEDRNLLTIEGEVEYALNDKMYLLLGIEYFRDRSSEALSIGGGIGF